MNFAALYNLSSHRYLLIGLLRHQWYVILKLLPAQILWIIPLPNLMCKIYYRGNVMFSNKIPFTCINTATSKTRQKAKRQRALPFRASIIQNKMHLASLNLSIKHCGLKNKWKSLWVSIIILRSCQLRSHKMNNSNISPDQMLTLPHIP